MGGDLVRLILTTLDLERGGLILWDVSTMIWVHIMRLQLSTSPERHICSFRSPLLQAMMFIARDYITMGGSSTT